MTDRPANERIEPREELWLLVEESLYHLRLDERAKNYHERALDALTRISRPAPSEEMVAKALQEADLHDGDEGNHYRLFDLLGFSGENKAVMITRQLARAAITAMGRDGRQ